MKKMILFVGLPLVVLGLFAWSASLQSAKTTFFGETTVACLPNGHAQVALHIHPILTITVDGEEEAIPANVGITGSCMSEMHTHDGSGTLHIETATRERFNEIGFPDFFSVWGQPIVREGHSLQIFVDGEEIANPEDIELEDGMRIDLMYTSENA